MYRLFVGSWLLLRSTSRLGHIRVLSVHLLLSNVRHDATLVVSKVVDDAWHKRSVSFFILSTNNVLQIKQTRHQSTKSLHLHWTADSEILQSTTTLSAGNKDPFPIQSIQHHGTSRLSLNYLSLVTKRSATITTFKAHLKTEYAAYDTV